MSSTGTVDASSRLVPSATVVSGPLGDELILLNLEDGAYFSLSAVAALAWADFDGRRSIRDIAQLIVREFETDEETATRDLLELSSELLSAGLVQIVTVP